jgi:hypothetical protein
MSDKKIITQDQLKLIRELIKNDILYCTGSSVMIGGRAPETFLMFCEDDDGEVWIATPTGVLLQKDKTFFDFCEEHSKRFYLEHVKSTLVKLKRINASVKKGETSTLSV